MAVLMKRCDQNNSFCVAPLPKFTEFGSLKQAAQLSPKAALPALCVSPPASFKSSRKHCSF